MLPFSSSRLCLILFRDMHRYTRYSTSQMPFRCDRNDQPKKNQPERDWVDINRSDVAVAAPGSASLKSRMNYKFIIGSLVAGLFSIFLLSAQDTEPSTPELAQYYVVFLVKGPHWTADETPETKRLQIEHLAHIRQMHDSGKLLLAGPFPDEGNLRGMGIFKTATLEEAKQLAEDDESVKTGRLRVEVHRWMTPKGGLP